MPPSLAALLTQASLSTASGIERRRDAEDQCYCLRAAVLLQGDARTPRSTTLRRCGTRRPRPMVPPSRRPRTRSTPKLGTLEVAGFFCGHGLAWRHANPGHVSLGLRGRLPARAAQIRSVRCDPCQCAGTRRGQVSRFSENLVPLFFAEWCDHSAGTIVGLMRAGLGAPTRRRRSDSESPPPITMTMQPSQISSTSGL